MSAPAEPMRGAVELGDGLTPVDIWQGLHANARSWSEVPYGASKNQDRILIDGTDLSVLKALATYPAEKWSSLCSAVGWTVYGAVGLSWCQGAELSKVWEAWETSGFRLVPTPDAERPARLLNPGLMPTSRKVSELIKETTPSKLAFCAVVASSDAPLDFDVDMNDLSNAPDQIASFLKSRTLANSDLTKKVGDLISIWDKRIKGTQYDIWNN